jgi:hypothetical protein
MKKGFKFTVARPKEHNEKIGKGTSKAFTEERKKLQSERMKKFWAQIKDDELLLERMKNMSDDELIKFCIRDI